MLVISYTVIFFIASNIIVFSAVFRRLIIDRTTVVSPELSVIEADGNVEYYCGGIEPEGRIVIISCGAKGSFGSYTAIADGLMRSDYGVMYIHRKKAGFFEAAMPFRAKAADVRRAVLISEKLGYKTENIIVLGHSLGGYSVLRLMKQKIDIRAVISVCGFRSWVELCRHYLKKYLRTFEGAFEPMLALLSLVDGKLFGNDAVNIINACASLPTKFYIIEVQNDKVVEQKLGLYVKKDSIKNSRVDYSRSSITGYNSHSAILSKKSALIIGKITSAFEA